MIDARVTTHMIRILRGTPIALRRVALTAVVVGASLADGQSARWTVDPTPVVTLGDAPGDTSVLFGAGLVSATRLPNGRILVADRGPFSFKLFAPDGKLLKNLGREGAGPGEFGYLARMYRCGDQILTYDIKNGNRISVFDLDVGYKRAFRFSGPTAGHGPYASTCNKNATFVHYGWEDPKDMKGGIFRSKVPVWTSGADSTVKPIIGVIPGSERWGQISDNRLVGTRPLPLGKESVMAIGDSRIFIGSADSYEIGIYDLDGKQIGTIRKAVPVAVTTKADIDSAMAREQAGLSEASQKRIAASYATMEFPKTLPAYRRLLIDADGLVWVQDYLLGRAPMSRWTVFTQAGAQQAEVAVPAHLEVNEIGRDYLLGTFIDPDDQIPQVRLYRLHRTSKP